MSNESLHNLIAVLKQIIAEVEQKNTNNSFTHNDEAFEMLTIKEASERFGVSVSSIRAWERKKMISSVRAGESGRGKILINAEILRKFLDGKCDVDNSNN